MNPTVVAALLLAGALAAQEPAAKAGEQPAANSCVTCHRDAETLRAQPVLQRHQFLHWYGSVHGKVRVGCERCHGGDPQQQKKELAHVGVEPAAKETSKVYYRNLPDTCGACHQEVAQQFRRSSHFENLKTDHLAPTCTTCHGFEMEIAGVRPQRLAERCLVCHNQRLGVKPEVGKQVDEVLDSLAKTKAAVEHAAATVQLAKEESLSVEKAEAALKAARERLRATGGLWHRFELRPFAAELQQIEATAEDARQQARKALLSAR